MADEKMPDLQELEDNGSIIFIPLGGSNLIHWTSRLKGLNRPEFHSDFSLKVKMIFRCSNSVRKCSKGIFSSA